MTSTKNLTSNDPPDDVLSRVTDAIFALDDEWRFTYVNRQAETLLERSEERLLGRNIWDEFPDAVESPFHRNYRRAVTEQEPATFEAYYDPLETWFGVRAYPSESGLTVYFRDVTERREREEELRRQRDELRTLNRLHTVVRDLARVSVEATTRDEIERRVCECLVEQDRFDGARINAVNAADETVTPVATVGDVPDETGGDGGPDVVWEAVRNSELQFVREDEDESASGAGTGDGGAAVAYVPLSHGPRLHGVLTLYATETTLDDLNRTLLEDVGETVAHTLASVENKERNRSIVDDVLETITVGMSLVDADGTVVWTNGATERYFGLDRAEMTGLDVQRLAQERVAHVLESPAEFTERMRALARGDGHDRRFECHVTSGYDRKERFLEQRSRPITSGLYAGGRVDLYYDVTERKRSEQALAESERRRAALVSNHPGIVYRCRNEREWPMEFVDGECVDLTGYDATQLETEVSWEQDLVHPEDRERVWNRVQTQLADGDQFEVTYRIRTREGDRRWVWEQGRVVDAEGDRETLEGFVTDITERKQAQTELTRQTEQFESLVDSVEEYAIFRVNPDGTVASWNDGAEEIKGYTEAEVRGEHISTFYTDGAVADGVPEANLAEAARTGQCTDEGWRVDKDGERFWANVVITALRDDDGTLRGFAKVTRDMSERRERTKELKRQHELTRRILNTSPVGLLVVSTDGDIMQLNDRTEEILGISESDMVGSPLVDQSWEVFDAEGDPLPPADRPWKHVLETGEAVYDTEIIYESADGERRWLSISAEPLWTADGELDAVVVAGDDITRQREHEQELRRQRDELATLNRINDVIRDIDRAVVRADTRHEIEQAVCERLAGDDRYLFAWVGEPDHGNELVPREWAGVNDGYLDAVTVTVDEGSETSEGPAGKTARSKEVAVVQRISEHPAFEPWREEALERGFRASAAVPIGYGDVLYGILGVYADQPEAFDEREVTLLSELGEMIGHAINAVQRKQALVNETVTEIRFHLTDAAPDLAALTEDGGRITIERTVETRDGVVQYLDATGVSTDEACEVLTARDNVDSVRVVRETDDHAELEVRTSGAVLTRTIASYGGRIKDANVAEGSFSVTTEFPSNTDVRTVVAAIQERYPTAEPVAQRTVDRELSRTGLQSLLDDELTDRQREALEAAYFSGYYEWPRESSGEDVATALGVSVPTVSQHLRAAHGKVVGQLFEDSSL